MKPSNLPPILKQQTNLVDTLVFYNSLFSCCLEISSTILYTTSESINYCSVFFEKTNPLFLYVKNACLTILIVSSSVVYCLQLIYHSLEFMILLHTFYIFSVTQQFLHINLVYQIFFQSKYIIAILISHPYQSFLSTSLRTYLFTEFVVEKVRKYVVVFPKFRVFRDALKSIPLHSSSNPSSSFLATRDISFCLDFRNHLIFSVDSKSTTLLVLSDT